MVVRMASSNVETMLVWQLIPAVAFKQSSIFIGVLVGVPDSVMEKKAPGDACVLVHSMASRILFKWFICTSPCVFLL